MMFCNITEKILYKYRSTSQISEIIRLISNGELWFSSAKSFNDPFDTAITYNFDGINSPIAEKWAIVAANRHMPNHSQSEKDKFIAERLKQFRNDPDFAESSRQEAIERNYNSFGICSLTTKNDNLLMWAHYANKHSGLCIGLSVEVMWKVTQEIIRRNHILDLIKVTYTKEMPKHKFFEAMLASDYTHVMDFVKTKSENWEYENEFRFVCLDSSNISIEFGSELVTEIIFGCKMQKEEKQLLADYCRLNYPRIRLCEARKDNQAFQLRIDSN